MSKNSTLKPKDIPEKPLNNKKGNKIIHINEIKSLSGAGMTRMAVYDNISRKQTNT